MPDYTELKDEQLITLIAYGAKDALDTFYDRYARSVFSLARHMLREPSLAEEVTQDIFLNLWLKASTFDSQRGTPKAWFMKIAHHRIIDAIRANRRNSKVTTQVDHELLGLQPSTEPGPEEEAQRNISRDEILAILASLPEPQREVIILAYFEGYSQTEIADRLGQPLGTIKTRVRLAMQKLRAALNFEKV